MCMSDGMVGTTNGNEQKESKLRIDGISFDVDWAFALLDMYHDICIMHCLSHLEHFGPPFLFRNFYILNHVPTTFSDLVLFILVIWCFQGT